MLVFRPTLLFAATLIGAVLLADGDALAVDPQATAGAIPLPRQRPANKTVTAHPTNHQVQKPASRSAPLSIAPATSGAVTPIAAEPANAARQPFLPQTTPLLRPAQPFAIAPTATTTPMDLSAVKQAVDLVGKNRQDEATNVEGTITDPLARKLVEWAILRSEDGSSDFSRYTAFISANPSWPSIGTLRRRAEGVMWQQQVDPQVVINFFASEPPHTAKGHFALTRALLTRGDTAGAAAALRETWRNDAFSADLEDQARQIFAGLITPADDQARMDARLYAEDDDAGLRAAHHLDATALFVAKARAAVINDAGNAKALLEAVPEAARHDPGYMFSRIQWLRREDKIPEAAQWMITAPHDPAKFVDVDQWWVERRLIARKLLDLGDAKRPMRSPTALPRRRAKITAPSSNSPPAGLRCVSCTSRRLRSRISPASPTASSNPITLARSFYWQGRATEALGRDQDARALYEVAAHYPTAYYGQLARARLGLDEVTLRAPPEPAASAAPRARARLRYSLRHRQPRPHRRHGRRPRRQSNRRRRAGHARRDRDAPQ